MSDAAEALHSTLLFEACGPVLLVGGGRPDLIPVLSTAAESVVLVVPPWREPGFVHDLEDAGVPVIIPERDDEGLPTNLPTVATLVVVDELPEGDPLLLVDRVLSAVAHEGDVCIDLDEEAVHSGRLGRLLEAGVTRHEETSWRAPGRLALHGRRRSPGRDVEPGEGELMSMTYVVVVEEDHDASGVIADVLLRQVFPAELLLIVDPHGVVDDGLWGMQSQGLTQPAILRPGAEAPRGAWLAEAMENIESETFCVLSAGSRLAPRHAWLTTAVLAAREDASAAMVSGFVIDEDEEDLEAFDVGELDENLTAALWGATPLPVSAVCYRTAAVRDCGGFDATFDGVADHDLWMRLAEKGAFAGIPLPLVCDADELEIDAEELSGVLAAAHERDAVGRLAAAFRHCEESARRPTALLHRALALSTVGLHARAVRDLEAARDGGEPAAIASTAARVHLRAGDATLALSALEDVPDALKVAHADLAAAAHMVDGDAAAALRALDRVPFESLEGSVLRIFALADVTGADENLALLLSRFVQDLAAEDDDLLDEDLVTF